MINDKQHGKPTILMVDDNPINLMELSDLLDDAGFDVLRPEKTPWNKLWQNSLI
jgi:CheY-like chemotaxis protein